MFLNLLRRTWSVAKKGRKVNKTNMASSQLRASDPRATMRFIQFKRKNDPLLCLGLVSEDGENFLQLSDYTCVSNSMINFIKQNVGPAELREKAQYLKCEKMTNNIQLLPPILNPEKIICVGLNYRGHCEEQKKELPKEPIFFSKFASAIVGPMDPIKAHQLTKKLDWEVELAVIIGKETKCITKEEAMDHVFGYCIAQDISARDWQKERNGGQFLIGKSMDTFCPLGPAIVHKSLIPDPHNLELNCWVNGQLKQKGNTKELIFRIDDIISRLSECITLQPGDILLTGTPAGVGMHRAPPEYLNPGDVVTSEIQCLGALCNAVIA